LNYDPGFCRIDDLPLLEQSTPDRGGKGKWEAKQIALRRTNGQEIEGGL
jgi:hypothetical protein